MGTQSLYVGTYFGFGWYVVFKLKCVKRMSYVVVKYSTLGALCQYSMSSCFLYVIVEYGGE